MTGRPVDRVAAAALWALVATGPLLGGVALLRPAGAATAGVVTAPPAAVLGAAELAVVAHLTTAEPAEVPAPLQPAHPAMRPGAVLADLPTAARAAAVAAASTPIAAAAPLDVRPAGPDRWGVVIGVLRGDRLETWQVTVAQTPGGPAVEGLPAAVAAPSATGAPTPATGPLRAPAPDDPLADAVDGAVRALLTGDPTLARYAAPGTALSPAAVVAATAALRRMAVAPLPDGRAAVLAEVMATRHDGAVHVMHQPLLLRRSADRWEVQAVPPALPVRPPDPDRSRATP